MPTSIKTVEQVYDHLQHPAAANRSRGPNGVGKIHVATLEDAFARATSRVMGDDDTAQLVDAGSSGSTTAAYRIALAAGAAMLLGSVEQRAALDDQDLFADIASYNLDGTDAAPIDTNDQDAKFALIDLDDDGTRTLVGVFGAVAGTGAAVAPTAYEIGVALRAADARGTEFTALNTRGCLIIGRGTAARGTDAVVITGVNPAADAAHKAERAGMVNPFGESITTA